MKTVPKIGIGLLASFVVFFGFLSWYKIHYAMDPAKEFEVNEPQLAHRILIATQGSEFKDKLVGSVIDRLKDHPAYIKVIDVSKLGDIQPDDWTVVLVIHVWEVWRPEPHAEAFINRCRDKSNIVIVCTSGDGGYKMEGVDAVTSASVMTDVPRKAEEVMQRVTRIMNLKEAYH